MVPPPTARLRGNLGPGWRAAAGRPPGRRTAAALQGVLGWDPLATMSAALHPCSALPAPRQEPQHPVRPTNISWTARTDTRSPGHIRGRPRAPEKATMFMTLRTAPIVSVTLPSQKDGTSSHILCARARAAHQRPSASAAAHMRVKGPSPRVRGPRGSRQRAATPVAGALAGRCGGRDRPHDSALPASQTKLVPGLRGACAGTDACAAVSGARQPPGAGLLQGDSPCAGAARLIGVVKQARLLVQPEERAVGIVAGHQARRQVAPPLQHEAALHEVCARAARRHGRSQQPPRAARRARPRVRTGRPRPPSQETRSRMQR